MDINNEIEDYLIKLGKRIAKLRKSKGLTQDDLWYKANIARRTVNKVELGQGDVKIGTLIKIAKALKVSLEKLTKI
ncbi:MAG: helix-turn-helix transcriptional regulator [Halobacteriovoraceae bacterium]|nr:helix-turn-helix transcriptional regulator [Halobacteriovoraceae bacterium]